MNRPLLLVLALSVACLVAASGGSSGTGPGGWDNLGTGTPSTRAALNGGVYALNTDSPGGLLYAGGTFTDAGGNERADYIAFWNGNKWAAVAPAPLNGAVHSIALANGKLYVGGVFTNAGGNANADFLAVWDGMSWGTVCNAPGSAINGIVFALEVVGSTLYVGGAFQDGAGIRSADYLVACDMATGASRSTVTREDGAFAGPVYALAADSLGRLYAGGGFINLERIAAADKVAYLDGGGWHAMGSGPGPGSGAVTDFVRSLAAEGTNVYVGTDASNVAGITQADHVVRWNGSAWSALGADTSGGNGWFPATASINALAATEERVFASGVFQNANTDPAADQIAYFDGIAWHPFGSNGAGDGPFNGNVSALARHGARLIAGGSFTGGGGNPLASFVGSRLFLADDIDPVITGFSLSSSSFRRGKSVTVRFNLSEPARVLFTVRRQSGANVSVNVRTSSTGANQFAFNGRFNPVKMPKPGKYLLRAIAVDASGNWSTQISRPYRLR